MKAPSLFFTACQPFQAARRLAVVNPEAALHGHGFEARIAVPGSACRGAFSGDETRQLNSILHRAVDPLDYTLINDRVDEPDDARMAEWLVKRAGLIDSAGLALRSGPDRGAIVEGNGRRLAWRQFRFEAAHRLPNVPAGHKCGRMHGHGFEVMLFVALEPDEDAWSVQQACADAWRWPHLELHLSCLNDLPGLENPTSEILARWIWQRINDELPGLAGITVMETPSAGCHYDGRAWRIWKSTTFDSAVRLARASSGDPRRMTHGHTFNARLHLAGGLDEVMGWVYDYGDVKQRFDPVFRALDHRELYEQPGLEDNDPASIAGWIDGKIVAEFAGLCRVDVLETPGCGALLQRAGGTPGLLAP